LERIGIETKLDAIALLVPKIKNLWPLRTGESSANGKQGPVQETISGGPFGIAAFSRLAAPKSSGAGHPKPDIKAARADSGPAIKVTYHSANNHVNHEAGYVLHQARVPYWKPNCEEIRLGRLAEQIKKQRTKPSASDEFSALQRFRTDSFSIERKTAWRSSRQLHSDETHCGVLGEGFSEPSICRAAFDFSCRSFGNAAVVALPDLHDA